MIQMSFISIKMHISEFFFSRCCEYLYYVIQDLLWSEVNESKLTNDTECNNSSGYLYYERKKIGDVEKCYLNVV